MRTARHITNEGEDRDRHKDDEVKRKRARWGKLSVKMRETKKARRRSETG